MTDEHPRTAQITLDFLDANTTYKATIYKDNDKTNYKTNPTALTIEQMLVKNTSVLSIPLAASGGVAISLIAE